MNAEQIAARLHRIIDEGPDPAEGLGNPLGIYSQGYQEGMRDLLAALREAGRDLDHTYEVQAWWDGTIGVDGNLTGVTEGSEGDPELWEPWARERYAIPLYVREPLGEDQ